MTIIFLYMLMTKRKRSLAIGQSRQKRSRQPTNVTEQADIIKEDRHCALLNLIIRAQYAAVQ